MTGCRDAAVAHIISAEGRIDMLVNNAGLFAGMMSVMDADLDKAKAMFDTKYADKMPCSCPL